MKKKKKKSIFLNEAGEKTKWSYKYMRRDIKNNIQYYALMLIPMLLMLIFHYLPLSGLVIAFQDYGPGKSFFGPDVEWVGLKWFKKFVDSFYFSRILRNTLRLSFMGLIFGFPVPIIFAIVLNEVKNSKFRKTIQTFSYLPHFLSAVIVAGIVNTFIADDGIITTLLSHINIDITGLNVNKGAFPWIYTITQIWMSFGWNSILYLSTITSIDPGQYEAAAIDGAGRLKRIWHITIPGLMPLIMIQLIMSIGGILGANSELILQLYNSAVYETADVIGTFTYRETLLKGTYSYGTACGLLLGLFGFVLTYIANMISRKTTDWSMW